MLPNLAMNTDLTSAWSASNYYRTELLMGVGQSFAFIGLVATIVVTIFITRISKRALAAVAESRIVSPP